MTVKASDAPDSSDFRMRQIPPAAHVSRWTLPGQTQTSAGPSCTDVIRLAHYDHENGYLDASLLCRPADDRCSARVLANGMLIAQ